MNWKNSTYGDTLVPEECANDTDQDLEKSLLKHWLMINATVAIVECFDKIAANGRSSFRAVLLKQRRGIPVRIWWQPELWELQCQKMSPFMRWLPMQFGLSNSCKIMLRPRNRWFWVDGLDVSHKTLHCVIL